MNRPIFFGLTASYCLTTIQFWMTIPLISIKLASSGVPAWKGGMIGMIPWILLTLIFPIAPQLAAQFGTLRIYRIGIWVGILGALCFMSDRLIWLWAIGYAFSGAGLALRATIAYGLVSALAPDRVRGARVGLFETFAGGTMFLGPTLLIVVGTEGLTPLLIGLMTITAALIPLHPIRHIHSQLTQQHRSSVVQAIIWTFWNAPVAMIAATAAGIIEGAATQIFPVQAVGLGLGVTFASMTATAYGSGNLLTPYLIGRLADRVASQPLIIRTALIMLSFALSIPIARHSSSIYLGLILFIGALTCCLYTLAIIEAGHSSSTATALSAIASINTGYNVGTILGASVGGIATSATLLWGPPLLIAIVMAIALIAIFLRSPGQFKI
jgi:MFS family permease